MKKARTLIILGIFITSTAVITTIIGASGAPPTNGPLDELIAGRNVNMVAGTRLPFGDPWMQRQNEPSIAVSTRNPLHLLAGSNDYRTVDMPDFKPLPGIPPEAAARDAWGGLFKSLDGGQSWITMLLPGFPQDVSPEGLASPIHGFDVVCDPCIRAGANGMFYYSGIAFMRSGGAGVVFVSRFIDNNNLEMVKKHWINEWQWIPLKDPIQYIDTRIIGIGNPGQFLDMASIAVDVPRGDSGSQILDGQEIPNARVYCAYTMFTGISVNDNVRSKLYFASSPDNGTTWGPPTAIVSESWHVVQRPTIAIDPNDPTGNTIYVAFRRFAHKDTDSSKSLKTDSIGIVKSINGGKHFTNPIEVAALPNPFDQVMTETRFRTNSYPTMAIDHFRNVHLAWAERRDPAEGFRSPDGQARIVHTYSTDGGFTWAMPEVVELNHPDYMAPSGGPPYLDGHQFMPSMTYAGGKLMLSWYDQRDTVAKIRDPNCIGEWVEDQPGVYRHTIDVRAAEWPLAAQSWFHPSQQISRYLYYLAYGPKDELPGPGSYHSVTQGEHNIINLPLFELGSKPFHGDYMDMASSPHILPPPVANGIWNYNTDFEEPTIFHATWTDNRDVRPSVFFVSPNDLWGDWVDFRPAISPQDSGWEPTYPCLSGDSTGNRNQNVYTASLTKGVIVGSPWNTKQLDISEGTPGGRRTFVVFVKNLTQNDRNFYLSFDRTPPFLNKAHAFFEQNGDKDEMWIQVGGYSSVSLTVYVNPTSEYDSMAPVKVDVREDDPDTGELVGYILLNPDMTNRRVMDPYDNEIYLGDEKHEPLVGKPKIWKYEFGNESEPHAGIVNPRVQNPRVQNTSHVNPRVQNPRVQNPRVQNKSIKNENVVNHTTANPRVQNPRVQNTTLTDITWEVTNVGNTTSAYEFDVISDEIDDWNDHLKKGILYGQVLVYKIHQIPADAGCDLMPEHHDELLVNISNPRVQNPRVQNITPTASQGVSTDSAGPDIGLEDATFFLAPQETAYITFRVYDPDTKDRFDIETDVFAGEVVADAVNTGETDPRFSTQADVPWETPPPAIHTSESSLKFHGAAPPPQIIYFSVSDLPPGHSSLPYSVSCDAPWLSIAPQDGDLSDIPLAHVVSIDTTGLTERDYVGAITVAVPHAINNPIRIPVKFTNKVTK